MLYNLKILIIINVNKRKLIQNTKAMAIQITILMLFWSGIKAIPKEVETIIKLSVE